MRNTCAGREGRLTATRAESACDVSAMRSLMRTRLAGAGLIGAAK